MFSSASDHELLASFARTRSEAAFAEIVRRYIDLVYSAARRQVASRHDAEEVAQSVFVDLARRAHALGERQPLAPWLYTVTRRTAIDHVRREMSRKKREVEATLQDAQAEVSLSWAELAPVLDEALASLREPEREAIVLRFLQERPLREVGAILGVSEDTAQKRVTRALDRLRSAFAARGLVTSSSILATQIGANAVQAAPASLGSAIVAALPAALAAGAGPFASFAAAFGRYLAPVMFGAGVVAAAIFETQAFARRRAERDDLQRQVAAAEAARTELGRQRAIRRQQLTKTEAEIARRRPDAEEMDPEVAAWFARITRLKQLAAENPERAIPEMRFLTERHWFDVARDAKFETEDDCRGLLRELRRRAKQPLGERFKAALTSYLDASEGELPLSMEALIPYLGEPLVPEILARYEIRPHGQAHALAGDEPIIVERTWVDDKYDTLLTVNRIVAACPDRTTVGNPEVRRALRAYQAANGGRLPPASTDLLPYLSPQVPEIARADFAQKSAEDFRHLVDEQANYVE